MNKRKIELKYIENSGNLCDYGCGRKGHYQFQNGKWCCENYWEKCPRKRKENSERNKGNIQSNKTKKKISKSLKYTFYDYQEKYPLFCKVEELREEPITKKIQVRCKNHNCKNSKEKGGWFFPTSQQLRDRQKRVKSKNDNEGCYLYCSEYCKKSHYLYGKKFTINNWKEKYPLFCKVEELREEPITKKIQVRCKNHNCKNSKEKGGWFFPTSQQLFDRRNQIEDDSINGGGCYFYCSDHCKLACDLYGKSANQIIKSNLIKSGYFPKEKQIPGIEIWRQEVIKRNIEKHGKLTCEYCGNTNENEMCSHHKIPIKINSEEALDPPNGEICCKFGTENNCHLLKGHTKGTEYSIGNLANRIC